MEYESRMDRIFSGSEHIAWKHRTLRTIFDPASYEWTETNLNEKVKILQTIANNKENIGFLTLEYRERYQKKNQRKDIANAAIHGLSEILEYLLIDIDDT